MYYLLPAMAARRRALALVGWRGCNSVRVIGTETANEDSLSLSFLDLSFHPCSHLSAVSAPSPASGKENEMLLPGGMWPRVCLIAARVVCENGEHHDTIQIEHTYLQVVLRGLGQIRTLVHRELRDIVVEILQPGRGQLNR